MANYYATIRTNYFSVKDENRFRELIQSVSTEDEVHIFEKPQSDGKTLYGFGCYGSIYGLPVETEGGFSETDMDYFLDSLQKIVSDGDAIIMTEVGYEKLQYVLGYSAVITSKEIKCVSIPDSGVTLARELLGNDDFETQVDY